MERVFPHITGDPSWMLMPVVDRHRVQVGYTAIYNIAHRTLATPVYKPEEARQ
jgi:hypothetical protein